MKKLAVFAALLLGGCAMASEVMDTGNGTFMISAAAAPVRGGAAGANSVAYKDANKFCAGRNGHAVVLDSDSSSVGRYAAGNTNMHFRCDQN